MTQETVLVVAQAVRPFIQSDSPSSTPRRGLNPVMIAMLLAAMTAVSHGWSLHDGLYFDDHLHFAKLKHTGWSWAELNDVTVVNTEQFVESWWQTEKVHWQYARPFAVLVAKCVVALFPEQPAVMHGLSLLLHLICAGCVYRLSHLLTRRQGWALASAWVFIIYSHSVYAVGWLAGQNVLWQTALTLLALLAYLHASGLDLYPESATPQRSAWSRGWGAVALGLWIVALLCRENAMVLPVLIVAFDYAFGGASQLRSRVRAYSAYAIIGAIYLLWRFTFAYHPYPDFYVRGYDGEGYLAWWLVKLLHYLACVLFQSPMMFGPTLRYNPLTETPGDCLLMLGIVTVMSLGYWLACRRIRGYWIWPLWVVLSVLPVVSVMATPHSGYMPGVGFCIALTLAPAMRDCAKPVSIGRWSKPVAIGFLVAITCYFPIYRTMWLSVIAAERLTVENIAIDPPSATVTDVYLINLPFVNVYAQLHLAERLNLAPVLEGQPLGDAEGRAVPRCHVLTFTNHVLLLDQDCHLEQRSPYEFSVKVAHHDRPYFSGAMGRFLIEAMREGKLLQQGELISRHGYRVEIVDSDETGVREMRFSFDKRLNDPSHIFYTGSYEREATRLVFDDGSRMIPSLAEPQIHTQRDLLGLAARFYDGEYDLGNSLLAECKNPDSEIREMAWSYFREGALRVAGSTNAALQDDLRTERSQPLDWQRYHPWWNRHVDAGQFRAIHLENEPIRQMRAVRSRLIRIQEFAEQILPTDMYLAGPPYPDPR